MRTCSVIASAMALALTSATAFAQMTPPANETPAVQASPASPAAPTAPAQKIAPGASPYDGAALPPTADRAVNLTAEMMIGKPLLDTVGDKVGTVADVVRDGSGNVTEIHADVGGILGIATTRVMIPAGQASIDGEAIRVSLSKEQIEAQPEVKS
ncbi:PRC-barrel domain-containing protein [Segnochrobactraceae bacterium EtOH-i3]